MTSNSNDYSKEYSEKSFWHKIKKFSITIGMEVTEKILTLYYCMRDPDTPPQAKATIIGALGYFIFPLDVIPDLAPIVGFSDDIGILGYAFISVATHIKEEHVTKAKAQVQILFGQGKSQT